MNTIFRVLVPLITLFVICGCSDDDDSNPTDENTIKIGALYPDAGGGYADSVEAIRLAIQDVNESSVLDAQVELVARYFNSDSDRSALAQELMRDEGVVAMTSSWSSTALKVLRLTNSPEYENIVQCSGSSTNTTINNPSTPPDEDGTINADQNGTLYRTTGNDILQAALLWGLVDDVTKLGILYIDDPYGKSFRDQLALRGSLALDASFPGDMSIAGEQDNITSILDANASGTLDTIVLVGLPEHGGPIMDALVDATVPFNGTVLVPDGMLDASFFTALGASFTAWLQRDGNKLLATAPEMYEGVYSADWSSRLNTMSPGVDLNNAFLPSHADCIYILTLAMLKGDGDASTIKTHMATFTDVGTSADAVIISPDAAGLQAAKAAIDNDQPIALDGASGRITFDDDGDRAIQLYKTLTVEDSSGTYSWVQDKVWDASTGECVKNCD